ncbi:MAG TPA: 2-C-methyl-D-erythritol 4-phosphate cytidylyltransferase [Longimicrobiales bacterium]|nr:2-C-methyl-D-erythritol 4-phosphate cytidylyltransferase [Longimicrobiales bacterium]
MSVRAGVVVPAAGAGRRMGGVDKAFLELAGEPVLACTLRPFLDEPRVVAIVVALDPATARHPPHWLTQLDERVTIVAGGAERGDSVRSALHALPDDLDIIAVHDAARPLLTSSLVSRVIDHAATGASVAAALLVTDTIHEAAPDGTILRTPDRTGLWAAQTPQAFPASVLRRAHHEAALAGIEATDDAALVTRFGATVHIIEGERTNLKLTVSTDVIIAEALIRSRE